MRILDWIKEKIGYQRRVEDSSGLTAAVIRGNSSTAPLLIWGSDLRNLDILSLPIVNLPDRAKSYRISLAKKREGFCFVRVEGGIRKYALGMTEDRKGLRLLWEHASNFRKPL